MLLLLYLFIFINCLIPDEFRSLVDKAIMNSTIKVPKGLREDTKYPGKYTNGNAHFTLHKILSSSQTKDLKGYAIEKNYAAIVKRKNFNITDEFVLIDIKNQQFYTMEKVVASDEKVSIYKVSPIDMFYIFSDIEAKVVTPLVSYKNSFNWDEKRNRPRLIPFGLFSAGVGAYFEVRAHAKVRFHSIKKADINADVTIIGKIGAELLVKHGEYKKYPDISLFDDIDLPVPGLSISFRFLGLPFEFGLFVTLGAVLKDMEKNLQVDIDYFKGYQLTAKRYICIKRHGISDSGWQTDFSPIPSGNVVEGTLSDLESNHIKATIQLKQGLKLKALVFNIISTELEFGIIEPFQISFGFSPLACPFPYLYGRLELPLKTYLSFTGVIIKIRLFGHKRKYKLIRPFVKERYLFHLIKTRKHCLFDSKNNYDYAISDDISGDDDDDDQFINETSNRIISLNTIDLENKNLTHTLISFQISLSEYNSSTKFQLQLFARRSSPFEDITSKKSSFDTSIVEAYQNRLTSKIQLNFLYNVGTNIIEKSNDYSFFLKEYLRKDDGYVPITIYNQKKTEGISVKMRLHYCENLTLNEMYVPSLRNGAFESNLEYGEKLCIIVKDLEENSTDYIDENATFITDGTLSEFLSERGIFSFKDEYFIIEFSNITLPLSPDSGTSVHYEICAEWDNNYAKKSLLISNFSDKFIKGLNILEDFAPKVRITESMRLFIYISYVHNYNIITLRQPVTYLEIQQAASSKIQSIIKTEPSNKISCAISIKRYTPIVKFNCSHANSTHRVITNVYALSSVRPSEYKPYVVKFKENQLYGVFELKKIHPNVKWVIIHMPLLQPLCNFTTISDEYYQIPFDKEVIYIPFRRENSSLNETVIKHVVQGNFIDEETIYFSSLYYTVDFSETPVALALVRTINNQYSVTNINGTKQTLIDYGNEYFKLLALEYEKDPIILVASSLIIIDEDHPLAEKTIPNFPNWESVIYHVWCKRADEIIMHDKTSRITTERNTERDGEFFKITVTPGHIIDFIPVCEKNLSQPLCYFRQTFSESSNYAVFRYPQKNGITILDTNISDLFEQEDRQGLIEEVIKSDKPFYYMTSFTDQVQIVRTYKTQLDIELRVIDVQNKYKKFCCFDPDGFIVPVSRKYYTDEYIDFMEEFGIKNSDEQYYDFGSGDNDSCIYATYMYNNNTDLNDTDLNDTGYVDIDTDDKIKILSENEQDEQPITLNPSTKICEVAKSIKVSYYKDINNLIPPDNFSFTLYTTPKVFDESWNKDTSVLNYEIAEYFLRANQRIEADKNNSLYVLYLPYKEFVFNITLNENEYISSEDNMTIHYVDGNLNYILPENYNTTIDLDTANEINVSLYGKGCLEIKTRGQSTLKIKGRLNLEDIKTLRVDNEIKLVEIENVNVVNYTELYAINTANESVKIKIINLTLLAHAKANLTNIEITDTLYIKQTATAFVDTTVSVKNAQLFIEMIAYQNDLIPMISGSLLEPPKAIYIERVTDDGPRHNDEYMIFDGHFDCQKMVDRMRFSNSLFNTARCAKYNDKYIEAQTLEEKESRAFVSFVRKPPIVKVDYNYGGMIAIIVLAICDAGILAAIIVLKMRKHRKGSYDTDHGTINDDLLDPNTRRREQLNI